MSATVIVLPCTHKMRERAKTQADRLREIEHVLWNARAALEALQKGNTGAAQRFIRHILATTESRS